MPHIPIALRIRAGRIPVRWMPRESVLEEVRDLDGRILQKGGVERVFWPQVETKKWGDVETSDIENPLDLRAQLFHAFNTNWNEERVLALLNRVGAWRIATDGDRETWTWARGTFANVAYGRRPAIGVRVVPVTLDEMKTEIGFWYRLLRALSNPAKLRAAFKTAPSPKARPNDHFLFALESQFFNTLPVSLEWQGKEPYAVVEAITASELLVAAAWADVVGRAEAQVCKKCGTRFTWPRKKTNCHWECGHLKAVRKHKRKKAFQKSILKTIESAENPVTRLALIEGAIKAAETYRLKQTALYSILLLKRRTCRELL